MAFSSKIIHKNVQIAETNSGPNVYVETEQNDDLEYEVDITKDLEDNALDPKSTDEGKHGKPLLIGKLVKKMLDIKSQHQEKQTYGTEVRMSTKHEDIEEIKNLIQKLCQSTNPMGKALDYLQENIDSMNRESVFWTKECSKYQNLIELQYV